MQLVASLVPKDDRWLAPPRERPTSLGPMEARWSSDEGKVMLRECGFRGRDDGIRASVPIEEQAVMFGRALDGVVELITNEEAEVALEAAGTFIEMARHAPVLASGPTRSPHRPGATHR